MAKRNKNLLIGCLLSGALGLLVLFLVLVLAARGCAGCVTGGGAGPYALVRDAASTDSRVENALGGYVQISPMPSGSINYMNGEGRAEMSLFIDGVDRDGTYVATVVKPRGGSWSIVEAELVLEDGNVVHLQPAVREPASGEP